MALASNLHISDASGAEHSFLFQKNVFVLAFWNLGWDSTSKQASNLALLNTYLVTLILKCLGNMFQGMDHLLDCRGP